MARPSMPSSSWSSLRRSSPQWLLDLNKWCCVWMVVYVTLLGFFWQCRVLADNSLNPIEIRGYKFFDSATGDEFRVRGIDYYPRPNKGDYNQNSVDYFTEEHRHIWERDIPYLRELGVNAIRIYAVDASMNHDAFFCALDQAGIYAIVELAHDCPTCAITKDAAPLCYPPALKKQGQDVIRAFAKYANVLGFSAGNEVNHYAPPGNPQHNAPCQKKFLRDMRQFIDSCPRLRNVPVGLVAADSDRTANALYYNCQMDPNDKYETAEWFGLNSYVYCDGHAQDYNQAAGFVSLKSSFASYNYSIPVVLTEFGCLSNTFPTIDGYEGQRDFRQANWLHTQPELKDQFVGGFVFEYSMEMENAKSESPYPFTKFGNANYGIGYFRPEECDDIQIPCAYHPLPSFERLADAYNAVLVNLTHSPSSSHRDEFVIPENRQHPSTCPKDFPSLRNFTWAADLIPHGACPRGQQFFVCPADLDQLRPSNRPVAAKFPLRSWMMVGIGATAAVVCLVVAVAIAMVVHQRNSSSSSSRRTDDRYQPIDAAELPWTTIVVVPKLRRAEGDTASNESMGLLSMQDYTRPPPAGGGDGVGDYQAIESDSSSAEEN